MNLLQEGRWVAKFHRPTPVDHPDCFRVQRKRRTGGTVPRQFLLSVRAITVRCTGPCHSKTSLSSGTTALPFSPRRIGLSVSEMPFRAILGLSAAVSGHLRRGLSTAARHPPWAMIYRTVLFLQHMPISINSVLQSWPKSTTINTADVNQFLIGLFIVFGCRLLHIFHQTQF